MVRLFLQSQYARALSQSIRTERFRRKRKSLPVTQEQQLPPKKFSISRNVVIRVDISSVLSEEFNKHVLQLQQEWRSQRCNTSHIDMLFKETYCNRRQWLPTLSTGRLAPILEKFPCFEEGKYVSNLMKFICIAVGPQASGSSEFNNFFFLL